MTASDPYGFQPRFVGDVAGEPRVSSDLLALLHPGALPRLDYDALSVFLRVGFYVGDDTPFAGVRAVAPTAAPTRQAQVIGREAAIDGFIALFATAVARRLPVDEYEMPLSGGRDSRHILLALLAAGRAPHACVTVEHFPPRGNDDIAVAAELCQRLGIRHVVVPQYTDRTATEREKNRRTHLLTDEHAQFVALADHLERSTRETYDGIAGDVLSQSGYLTPEAHARFSTSARAAAAYVLDGYGTTVSEDALRTLVAPALLRHLPRERAVARLEREIARHLDAPNPVSSFFFWNRTRREIALGPFGVMRALRVHTPYLDPELVEFLSSLPASLVMDRRLHTDAIARAYPHVSDVPYEAKDRVDARSRQRQLAVALGAAVVRARHVLNAPALLPRIAATAVDGDAARLWHASLVLYLGQLAEVAAVRAT